MKVWPKSTLIISTYNWPEALELTLISVLRQIVLPDEVIIADDGSTQATANLIQQYAASFPVLLKHVWHKDEGFRKTIILNKAVEESQFEYIIQIDGDVILEKHFIKDHLASAELNAFIRGTRAMLSEAKTEELLESKDVVLSPFKRGLKHRNNAVRLFSFRRLATRKEMSSRRVRGSNLSYWKKDFVKVNGYNNNLQGWGHEDEELAARFINNGVIKKIVKLSAVQYHLHHAISSAKEEPIHRHEVERVIKERIKVCVNGFKSQGNLSS